MQSHLTVLATFLRRACSFHFAALQARFLEKKKNLEPGKTITAKNSADEETHHALGLGALALDGMRCELENLAVVAVHAVEVTVRGFRSRDEA